MERHYHHGDAHEVTGLHYCRRCDAFEASPHFEACARGEGAERRRRDELASLAVRRHDRWRVVYHDPLNLFA